MPRLSTNLIEKHAERGPGGAVVADGKKLDEAQLAAGAVAHIKGRELPDEDVALPELPKRVPIWQRALYGIVGLGLFVTALGLLKEGANALIPTLEGSIFTDNAWSALGLGWLFACIVMSGSPVAASSLALLDGGAIDRTQSFAMLTGSRLGAAFVVLVVGAVYALRNQTGSGKRAPLSIGVLSLVMTVVTYLPGAAIGYLILESGRIDDMTIGSSPKIDSATSFLFGWAVDLLQSFLPGWTLFPIGVVVLLAGFAAFDRVLPQLGEQELEDRPPGWYERKWTMFLLGAVVCTFTLSVSVSLTFLVPLVAKGYVRRANVLPYIAGANITTLIDTFVAAVLLGNAAGVQVVVAVTIGVTLWTVALLLVAYPQVRALCLGVARWSLRSRKHLAAFVAMLIGVPIVLIAI